MALQNWGISADGGYFANPQLSKKLRHAAQPRMKFRQFVDVRDAAGKSKGDEFEFLKISNVQTAGGTLVETATMPETKFAIVKGTLTINEYGNSVPYTGKLEALSEFNINDPIQRVLRDDMAKTLDSEAGTQFKASYAKYVCSNGTSYNLATNGTASDTASSNLNAYHVKNCVDQLRKWNIEPYDGKNYVCIASVNALRGLKDDTEWLDAAKYGDPKRLFAGEVGRYYGCRFIEETAVLVDTLGGSYGEAVFFGRDAVAEGIAIPEEIRAKIPGDYGRSKGVAWYAIAGYKIMWNFDVDSECHIIHVTSL